MRGGRYHILQERLCCILMLTPARRCQALERLRASQHDLRAPLLVQLQVDQPFTGPGKHPDTTSLLLVVPALRLLRRREIPRSALLM